MTKTRIPCSVPDCRRKIQLLYIAIHTCKCQHVFCSKHRILHNCDFDHFANNQETLCRQNPEIKTQVLNTI